MFIALTSNENAQETSSDEEEQKSIVPYLPLPDELLNEAAKYDHISKPYFGISVFSFLFKKVKMSLAGK